MKRKGSLRWLLDGVVAAVSRAAACIRRPPAQCSWSRTIYLLFLEFKMVSLAASLDWVSCGIVSCCVVGVWSGKRRKLSPEDQDHRKSEKKSSFPIAVLKTSNFFVRTRSVTPKCSGHDAKSALLAGFRYPLQSQALIVWRSYDFVLGPCGRRGVKARFFRGERTAERLKGLPPGSPHKSEALPPERPARPSCVKRGYIDRPQSATRGKKSRGAHPIWVFGGCGGPRG